LAKLYAKPSTGSPRASVIYCKQTTNREQIKRNIQLKMQYFMTTGRGTEPFAADEIQEKIEVKSVKMCEELFSVQLYLRQLSDNTRN
jgi:hypothetical protein